MDRVFGGFFKRFNKVFHCGSEVYCKVVPGGFVPAQDKEYLISFAQLPNGASLDPTEGVIREMSVIALKQPVVEARWNSRACR